MDSVTVTEDVMIGDVDVFVDVTHTYMGDVDLTLTGPGDVSVSLISGECSFNDDLFAFFSDGGLAADCDGTPAVEGTVAPADVLSVYNGTSSMGEWTLTAEDVDAFASGTLNEWCVYITPET